MKKFDVSINMVEHYLTQEVVAETLEEAIDKVREQIFDGDIAVVSTNEGSVTVTQQEELEGNARITRTLYSTQEYGGWTMEDVEDQIYSNSDEFPKLLKKVGDKELLYTILNKFLDKLDVSEQLNMLCDILREYEDRL